jgi:hypothetical protein
MTQASGTDLVLASDPALFAMYLDGSRHFVVLTLALASILIRAGLKLLIAEISLSLRSTMTQAPKQLGRHRTVSGVSSRPKLGVRLQLVDSEKQKGESCIRKRGSELPLQLSSYQRVRT